MRTHLSGESVLVLRRESPHIMMHCFDALCRDIRDWELCENQIDLIGLILPRRPIQRVADSRVSACICTNLYGMEFVGRNY